VGVIDHNYLDKKLIGGSVAAA